MKATRMLGALLRARPNRWIARLWNEWFQERRRPILHAFAHPDPTSWDPRRVTASWLGHSTVLINFYGVTILTDPVLFPRIGVRLPGLTIGPKRLMEAALKLEELPPIDLVLLSHAHFDHLDTRTLHWFRKETVAVTASRTSDLLRRMKFGSITELRWGEKTGICAAAGSLQVTAFEVNHWGARMQTDDYRGYSGYVLEREGRRIIFGGDSAMTGTFAGLQDGKQFDLAIMAIGAYQPWIRAHCTPEQAIEMANAAGADHIMPVHHQTFRLSFEPFREPIERFERALRGEPDRIALREIGETFVLPE